MKIFIQEIIKYETKNIISETVSAFIWDYPIRIFTTVKSLLYICSSTFISISFTYAN